ncbi:MAG: DUF1501 domain-containing protein [Dehalococcoidia bacterium]
MAKDPVLVVFQLTGGNDYLNTIIPRNNPLYRDYRKLVVIPEGEEIPIDDDYGFHPEMAPLKPFWDEGKMALIHGIGYENSPRSHFRSMDIWHTCEPDKVGTEGWVGRVIKTVDPNKDNVLTGVNFGQGLPRAMALPGVPVASVSDIENYGVLTGITAEDQRARALERFARMYSPAIGRGPVMDYLGQTGLDALKGADILKTAPEKYSSTVEYAATPIAQKLRGIAMVHLANLGTRVFYTQHASFDTHASQMPGHQQLWKDCSAAISDFFADLREHDAADNVVMIMFTEFGRRVRDNGSGTDHGAGGVAFAIGDPVKGGHYSEYPSLKLEDLQEGDLAPNYDFRGFYSSLLEQHMGLDPTEIVDGTFEQLDFIRK